MRYWLTIRGFDSGLNEVLNAVHYDFKIKKLVNFEKKKNDNTCIRGIRASKELRDAQIKLPIVIHYKIYAKDKRRDRMNIASAFDKSFQDALQKVGLIRNDGWNEVYNATYDFAIDKTDPRVEVCIEEVEQDNEIWKGFLNRKQSASGVSKQNK